MQNSQLDPPTAGTPSTSQPRFYHYCYICNTQLNSCKQALLHCSGKRHRKKLQFLQSRKASLANATLGASNSNTHVLNPPDTTGILFAGTGGIQHPISYTPFITPNQHDVSTPPPLAPLMPPPSCNQPPSQTFLPIMTPTGVEWYSTHHQQPTIFGSVNQPQNLHNYQTNLPFNHSSTQLMLSGVPQFRPFNNHTQQAEHVMKDYVECGMFYGSGASSSSAYSVDTRSAVISPSDDTSSLSSEAHSSFDTVTRSESRCSSSTSSDQGGIMDGHIILDSGYVSSSGPDESSATVKYFCQLCNLYLNSPDQTQQHLNSQKHLQRSGGSAPLERRIPAFRKRPQSETCIIQANNITSPRCSMTKPIFGSSTTLNISGNKETLTNENIIQNDFCATSSNNFSVSIDTLSNKLDNINLNQENG